MAPRGAYHGGAGPTRPRSLCERPAGRDLFGAQGSAHLGLMDYPDLRAKEPRDGTLRLGSQLKLERCPHCRVHRPTLTLVGKQETTAFNGSNERTWAFYSCQGCGGMVMAWSRVAGGDVAEVFPSQDELDAAIPDRARTYLQQSRDTLHAPDGAVMLAASAVDAMLKAKAYSKGTLNERIKAAAADHLITGDMARWAHHVRLEANNPRHVDEDEPHATPEAAAQAVEFATQLANFLFVLPSRVTRGLEAAGRTSGDKGSEAK